MSELHKRWRPSAALFFTLEDTEIATIPLDFMRSAHIDNWTYVRYVLRACVDITDDFRLYRDDIQVVIDDPVVPGSYEVKRNDISQEWTFLQGPQGKSLSRARNTVDDEASDSVSQSSRLTGKPAQIKFRSALLARDGKCLVTGSKRLVSITACHIIFQSLGQSFLDQIIGVRNQVTVMDPQNGLLLSNMLHHPFDQFLWGIYYEESTEKYYVHSFDENPEDPTSSRAYHGRALTLRSDFRELWPHQSLLNWHYKQCVMAHIRGFAAGQLH